MSADFICSKAIPFVINSKSIKLSSNRYEAVALLMVKVCSVEPYVKSNIIYNSKLEKKIDKFLTFFFLELNERFKKK